MSNNNKTNKSSKNQKTYKQQKSVNGNTKKLKKQKSCEQLEKASTANNNAVKDTNKLNQRTPYSHKSLTLVNEKPSEINSKNQKNQQNPLSDRDNNIIPPVPKMERSKSFFLTRKISKMLNHLSGSKENLSTVPPSPKEKDVNSNSVPYQFIRSKSMILLKTAKRKNYGPQLEKLSEESERPNSPEQISNGIVTNELTMVTTTPTTSTISDTTSTVFSTPSNTTSVAYKTNTLPIIREPYVALRRTSFDFGLRSASAIVPADFAISDRRKSSGVFKETLKRIVTTERRKSVNTKWSASLQSLQEIDNMVSYENLSFIDYDKFNEYEKQLNRLLTVTTNNNNIIHTPAPSPISPCDSLTNSTNNVRFREKKGRSNLNREQFPKSVAVTNFYENQASISNNENNINNFQTYSLDDQKLIEIGENYQSDFQKFENYTKDNKEDDSLHSSSDIIDYSTILRKKVPDMSERYNNNLSICGYTKSAENLTSVKSKSLTHLDVLSYPINDSSNNTTLPDQPVVSSSEYFSVHFHIENGAIEEELIQIKKGVTLLGALDSSLKRRNLTISQINITDSNIHSLAETGSPPYGSLIDENIDTESLLGKILIVTEKNDSYLKSSKLGSLQKAASFGSRARPPRLLSSASTEETSSEPDPKVIPAKQLKQRWSGLFGVKNPQQNQLCELLSKFSKSGGPPKKYSIQLEQPAFETDALNYLQNSHKCWREFIYYDDLSDNEIKIQSAIWELVTTEIDYIHTLQTVTDLFLACLEALQEENILTDVDQNKLFSNIREICEANLKFWTSYLYPMVANSIANRTPLHIDYFEQGFVTFGLAFSPYKVYCAEQSTCQFYCKELNRTNTVFTTYLAWCESQKNCNRLRLADILVRPMQRLTKYSLLLIAIRKNVIFENDGEMLDSMIRSVENFVYSVNTHLSTRQENERLKGIMARIESYDVVETNNEQLEKFVKQYSQMFDLCAPMKGCSTQHCRHLFMEGDLKLKDSVSKSDVHCFLLTDILLICKTISKKSQGALKVIRQPYFTDRLMIKHKDNSLYCVYLNEFQVATSAFSLQCSEAKNWHDGITKAKHIYTRLKQNIQWDINLRGYNQSSSGDNVNMLGVKKSPLNSSRGSRVSSLNNSHSGSVELNDSKNISVDLEKANSLSSDEGANFGNQNTIQKTKSSIAVSPQKQKAVTANTLSVQPLHSLGQSLPNLTSPQNQVSCNLYHTYSNNTLLVPGYGRGCPSNNLLSPSHRGISYPPPSPTRGTLRRGFAFSSTIKNPPLVKTRNITSQNSVNWYQTILPKTATQQQQEGISHFPGLLSLASSESAVSPNQVQNTYPSKETTKATSLNTTFDVTPQQATNESDV